MLMYCFTEFHFVEAVVKVRIMDLSNRYGLIAAKFDDAEEPERTATRDRGPKCELKDFK